MNCFKRKSLLAAVLAGLMATGCGLNPKQLQAIDGAMCAKIYGTTTTIVGGSSKSAGTKVDGETCSITTVGAPK